MSILQVQDTITTGLSPAMVPIDMWEHLNECPLCPYPAYLVDLIAIDKGPTLCACKYCHFGFISSRPTEEWINSFYATQWDQTGPPSAVASNTRAFNVCSDYFNKKPRVLDVGAGYGGMLLPFQGHGCSVEAIEASNQRARFLESIGIEIASTSLSEAPAGRYDLAIMHHSLEHVYDPVATMADLHRVLTSDGMVYIAVPDLWQEHPIQAAHYVPHLSLFTMESLLQLLKQNGFAPVVVNQGYDLEVVAIKNNHEWGCKIEYDFIETIDKWVQVPVGNLDGQITSVWSTSSFGKIRYPKWLSHDYVDKPYEMLPIGDGGMVRVVWGILSQDNGPLIICHPDGDPTVWIK